MQENQPKGTCLVVNKQRVTVLLPVSGLDAVSLITLPFAAVCMAIAYGAWLFLSTAYGDHNFWATLPVIIGIVPFALWAIYDYRMGLLFSILAAPLLNAPSIPHGFTQGFGDLFAACSIIGYLLRNPRPSNWVRLWRREYSWLVLILIAAAVSLANSPVWGQHVPYGIKYGLAETAGYSLLIVYLAIFVHELQNFKALKTAFVAMALAALIVLIFSFASLGMSLACVGEYASRTALTTAGAVSSTFSNPNYHASYIVAILPLGLWCLFQKPKNNGARHFATTVVFSLILMVQTAMSRSGLLGLVLVWAGWTVINYSRASNRLITVVFGLLLPLTLVLWWYPAFNCQSTLYSSMGFIDRALYSERVSKDLGTDISVRTRLARNAIGLWKDNPVTGVGAGLMTNYSSVMNRLEKSHNSILTLAAEQGILGLFAWGGWVAFMFSRFWKMRSSLSKQGYLTAFLFLSFISILSQSMFIDSFRVIWFWQIAALILGWSVIASKEGEAANGPK
jgi:O-antigen ligase